MKYGVDIASEIEKAVASGVGGITLFQTPSQRWQAARQVKGDTAWSVVSHHDPILALMGVLTPASEQVVKLHAALQRAVAARS